MCTTITTSRLFEPVAGRAGDAATTTGVACSAVSYVKRKRTIKPNLYQIKKTWSDNKR